MTIAQKIMIWCLIPVSCSSFGMEKQDAPGGSAGNPGNINIPVPSGFLAPFKFVVSSGKKALDTACEHNEGALAISTWLIRYKLWEMQQKQKDSAHAEVHNTFNVTIVAKDDKDLSEELNQLLVLADKKAKKNQVRYYYHSDEFREQLRAWGEGIEAANISRALSFSSHYGACTGISKPNPYTEKEYTPLVRYFEVAGSHADVSEALRYIKKSVHDTPVQFYVQQVPESIRYGVERTALGAGAVGATTFKDTMMSLAEILTYRGIELGARVGKEYCASNNSLVQDGFDSLAEAAQRQPYLISITRKVGDDTEKRDGIAGVVSAATSTGTNAISRFAVKQVPRILNETEAGKEIVEWTNDNVPEVVKDVVQEAAVAGLTMGALHVGKFYGPSCSLV